MAVAGSRSPIRRATSSASCPRIRPALALPPDDRGALQEASYCPPPAQPTRTHRGNSGRVPGGCGLWAGRCGRRAWHREPGTISSYGVLVSLDERAGSEQCPQCGESDLQPYGNGSKWACPRCYFVVPCCDGGELAAQSRASRGGGASSRIRGGGRIAGEPLVGSQRRQT